jgi:methionine-rich copper-binding protein CopC
MPDTRCTAVRRPDEPDRARHRRWRLAALVTAVAFMLVGFAPAASAHSELSSSDPADGSNVDAAPTAVTLVFNQPIEDFQPQIVITGPDGQTYPASAPTIDNATVRSDLGALGPAGAYIVAYRVVSADGHPIQGSITFQLAEAAVAAPPSASSGPLTSSAAATDQPGTVTIAPDTAQQQTPSSDEPTGATASTAEPAVPSSSAAGPSTESSSPDLTAAAAPGSSDMAGFVTIVAITVTVIVVLAVAIFRRRNDAPTAPPSGRSDSTTTTGRQRGKSS